MIRCFCMPPNVRYIYFFNTTLMHESVRYQLINKNVHKPTYERQEVHSYPQNQIRSVCSFARAPAAHSLLLARLVTRKLDPDNASSSWRILEARTRRAQDHQVRLEADCSIQSCVYGFVGTYV